MYFFNDVEKKTLLGSILPTARKVGVSEELRGWNWFTPPLKPLYTGEGIPNYLVGAQYCATARDVFVARVRGIEGKSNIHAITGSLVHKAVSTVVLSYVEEGREPDFDEWWKREASIFGSLNEEQGASMSAQEGLKKFVKSAWNQTSSECLGALLARRSAQPYASEHDVRVSALPFLVEHKVDGRLLGLSGILSVDCYDYLHGVIFDLKYLRPGSAQQPWRRLYSAGYAIVLESVYEIPIDVGCVIYVSLVNNQLKVSRDIFFIGDDVRGWWLEERDKKLEIIAQKKDPGLPSKCYDACLYLKYCLGDQR
ncbi:MAG: type I-A CRISPR-associated protein Cas4/Csa1 [Nitrososphaerota archaeon]